jgi:hypothetical protein
MCKLYLHLQYHSPWLCGHSVGLVLIATRKWFIRFCIPPKNLGDPGSSRGTLERVRVDLTAYKDDHILLFFSLVCVDCYTVHWLIV